MMKVSKAKPLAVALISAVCACSSGLVPSGALDLEYYTDRTSYLISDTMSLTLRNSGNTTRSVPIDFFVEVKTESGWELAPESPDVPWFPLGFPVPREFLEPGEARVQKVFLGWLHPEVGREYRLGFPLSPGGEPTEIYTNAFTVVAAR